MDVRMVNDVVERVGSGDEELDEMAPGPDAGSEDEEARAEPCDSPVRTEKRGPIAEEYDSKERCEEAQAEVRLSRNINSLDMRDLTGRN